MTAALAFLALVAAMNVAGIAVFGPWFTVAFVVLLVFFAAVTMGMEE